MHYVVTSHGLGRVEGDEVIVLDTVYPHVSAVLEELGSLSSLRTCPARMRVPLADATFLRPLGRPRAVWGVGLNYYSKAERAGRTAPERPILYLAASSSVLAPSDPVEFPSGVGEPDYEAEIAVIIGRRLDGCDEAEVWPAIAGITAANDMTARDVMRDTMAPVLAKSFPGFTPLGPSVCELDALPSRESIGVRTWINGTEVQNGSSADMIFSIPDLISRLSTYATLHPGDVVLTGTPAGTGLDRSVFLEPGDEIRVEVDGVLPLITRMAGGEESAAPTRAAVPSLVAAD